MSCEKKPLFKFIVKTSLLRINTDNELLRKELNKLVTNFTKRKIINSLKKVSKIYEVKTLVRNLNRKPIR